MVTRRDLAPLFGENPATLLRDARGAASTDELRGLNQRARAFVLDQLTSATSVDWLARFAHMVDAAILSRVAGIVGMDKQSASWCFAGSSGRGESLTTLVPMLLAVFEDHVPDDAARSRYRQVYEALLECGYLPRPELPFGVDFYAATAREWKARFRDWIDEPVRQQTSRARSLFDVRAVHGAEALWHEVRAGIAEAVDREFVHVLANDCLASLPPLTFFQDAVVDSLGEHTLTFRLEHSALRPLVDVGRVFALAARDALGRSTIERFAIARGMLPEQEAIFRDATETLRIVLWQQGRIGISQGTDGAELPAALLSRYDRQALKSGFPSIQRLLEFTADLTWLDDAVSGPAFLDRYRACFDRTWQDETPLAQLRFVVLDSETTGLDPRTDRLITIGAVAVIDGDIVIEDSFEALLRLTENTSAVTVHGITRDESQKGVEEPQALEAFLGYLRDGVIVGHHIGHDIATLDARYTRHWGVQLLNRSLDTMDLTLHLERDGAFAGRPPIRRFTLDSLCELFGVVPHDRHTASGDAFITAQVFLRLLRLAARTGRGTMAGVSEAFEVDEPGVQPR